MKNFEQLIYEFEHPLDEFSPMPFWFWNDILSEDEITRQINEFYEKGVNGFIIHARLGLDPNIEYMGEKWLYFAKFAVDYAKKLGMKVILYDEAMYPSGSCCGQVVEKNSAHASKGLKMSYSPDLKPDEMLIAESTINGKKAYFIQAPTYGTIRGAYFGQDDGENAPRSADLMSFDAVKSFIELTHQRYYDAMPEHFGDTVIAVFTDEPSIVGRCVENDIIAWTDGFLNTFKTSGYDENDLYLLFEEKNSKVKDTYNRLVYERMNESYYAQLSEWCVSHGVVLTGHPEHSTDIGLLSHFGIPCQDIVWRYVYPGDPTNVIGEHSTMAKCASDSARHRNKRRNGNECFGVCGHKDDPYTFTRSDMKWYIDWLFARGCNMIIPHAFYYSLRDKRKEERPPEVGIHSGFWNEYKEISDYIKRCSAINTDSVNITDTAILCTDTALPDIPAKSLYENRIEFNYLEESLLTADNGRVKIANQEYSVIIIDRDFDEKTIKILEKFRLDGGTVIDYREFENDTDYIIAIKAASKTGLDTVASENVRLTHVKKYGIDIVFLSNEGEKTEQITFNAPVAEIWDAEKGTRTPYSGDSLTLTLNVRESVHLILK